jgi:hypothetical protein
MAHPFLPEFCEWFTTTSRISPETQARVCDDKVFCANYLGENELYKEYSLAWWQEQHAHYSTTPCEDCFLRNPQLNPTAHEGAVARLSAVGISSYPSVDWEWERAPAQGDNELESPCLSKRGCRDARSMCHLALPDVGHILPCFGRGGGINVTCMRQSECTNCEQLLGQLQLTNALGEEVKLESAFVYVSFKSILDTNSVSKDLNWDWAGATFFATTVITTIGYGNFAPVTNEGKKLSFVPPLCAHPASVLCCC